ncbi:MAG: hypothetical protein U0Z44_21520 [Kouleothrix sp.]
MGAAPERTPTCCARGALDPAAAEYRAVLERDPANTQAMIGLAQIGAAKGDLPGALALAEALVRTAPGRRRAPCPARRHADGRRARSRGR